MSAIFGVLELEGGVAERSELARMSDALKRNSPDAGRIVTRGPIGIGHLLMRFTPQDETERQSLVSRDGEFVLVADGRVDNRSALARELGLSAAVSSQLSDSGLVLCAYQRWGKECLPRLVGEFAFAVWDELAHTLVLAGSAPLSRPLCYWLAPQRFAFASQPRGLFALPGIERWIDEERLADYLAWIQSSEERSLFADVRRLLPGQVLVLQRDTLRVERWWQPQLGEGHSLDSDEDYVEAFKELLEQVVSEQLRDAGPVAIQLSGGLDSGTVAAVAADQLASRGGSLPAYTAIPRAGFTGPVPDNRVPDELPLVRALATIHANIDPRPVRSHAGLLERADWLFDAAEVPFGNATNRGWIEAIYERAYTDEVGTLLTGDYGNLTVSWDGRGLLPVLIRRGRLAEALAESRAQTRAGHAASAWRAMANGIRPLLPETINGAIEWLRRDPGAQTTRVWVENTLINPEFAVEHRLSERAADGWTRRFGLVGTDSGAVRLRWLLGTGSRVAAIHSAYRALFGIDTRTPLADRRLVELCLTMPEEQFARGGETRWLIRRAMAGRLPDPTLHGGQRGLQAADWFDAMSAERNELLSEVARFEGNDLARKVLDLPRLRRLLEEWPHQPPADPRAVSLYRGGIGMALMTGRFLLWAQQGGASGRCLQ